MDKRFIAAIVIVVAALSVLIYTAVTSTAMPVVTVNQLVAEGVSRKNIRLGARVAGEKIIYSTQPTLEVKFIVRDISGDLSKRIKVSYQGLMPDTLKVDRDVIMEGSYNEGEFVAKSLITQCPSKYEPPIPGQDKSY